jgi:alpha-ketoglutarate-dependent taurine dioxygenase
MNITPLSTHVGVEITGVAGSDSFDARLAGECETLLARHGVVVFRDAAIDDDTLVSFSSHLGQLVVQPTGEHARPEIQTITMQPGATNPVLAMYRRGNFLWHIDGATDEFPQKGTFLSARETDDAGQGGTEFASTYAAYDALPDDDKRLIDDLKVVHSFATAQQRANPDASDEFRATWTRVPERIHPLVWKRRDGRRSLLLGATACSVVGWSQADSDALLDRLLAFATQPQFVIQHQWRKGDLVTWDNTGMLHRAMPFEPTSPRLLHRTTLVGQEQVA